MSERHITKKGASVFLLFLITSLLVGARAFAQNQLELPMPHASPTASKPKFAVDLNGNLIEQGPSPAVDSAVQSTLEIPKVPPAFEGCWEGTITQPKSWRRISGPQLGGWIPKTLRLCFRRAANEKFDITLQNTRLDTASAAKQGYPVSAYDSQTQLINSDGERSVQLHTVSTMTSRTKFLWLLPGPWTTSVSTIDSNCVFENSDNGALECDSSDSTTCGGAPSVGCNGGLWIESTWRLRYLRIRPQP